MQSLIRKTIIKELDDRSFFDLHKTEEYQACYVSDIMRMEIVKEFFNNVEKDPTFNIEEPDYDLLVDDWDGYEDQAYIQNDLTNDKFIFFEGWIPSCWKGAYSKPEYKGLTKQQVLEKIIGERFPRIGKQFGFEIDSYDYFGHRGKYIMSITFKKV